MLWRQLLTSICFSPNTCLSRLLKARPLKEGGGDNGKVGGGGKRRVGRWEVGKRRVVVTERRENKYSDALTCHTTLDHVHTWSVQMFRSLAS